MIGATAHLLSNKLDAGKVLFQSSCKYNGKNPFEFTMYSIKSALIVIVDLIQKKNIKKIIPRKIKNGKLIKNSKTKEFNEKILIKFNKIKFTKFNNNQFLNFKLINPFLLNLKKLK